MTKNDETKIKYLEMLQAVISRMNSNAFAVKNWFMVSVGGLMAMFFKTGTIAMLLLAIIITLAFFMYDASYLQMERWYREKYKRALKDESNLFDMVIDNDIKNTITLGSVMNSPSLGVYKVAGIILIILAIFNIPSEIHNIICSLICIK